MQEQKAREYLENVSRVIEEMNENYSKDKINEKLNIIFNKEKKLEEKQINKNIQERQKELGSN